MPDDHKLAEERRLQKVTESLGRLLSNGDFKVFVDDITEKLLNQRDENDELQGEALIRGQGASRAYRSILQTIDQSPALYTRLRVREGKRVQGNGGGLG